MKYDRTTKVIVPYADYDGNGQFALFTFRGSVDHRRVWREVRKGIYKRTQRQVSTSILKKISVLVLGNDVRRVTNEVVNEWLGQLTKETESETPSDSSGRTHAESLPDMRNSDAPAGDEK